MASPQIALPSIINTQSVQSCNEINFDRVKKILNKEKYLKMAAIFLNTATCASVGIIGISACLPAAILPVATFSCLTAIACSILGMICTKLSSYTILDEMTLEQKKTIVIDKLISIWSLKSRHYKKDLANINKIVEGIFFIPVPVALNRWEICSNRKQLTSSELYQLTQAAIDNRVKLDVTMSNEDKKAIALCLLQDYCQSGKIENLDKHQKKLLTDLLRPCGVNNSPPNPLRRRRCNWF